MPTGRRDGQRFDDRGVTAYVGEVELTMWQRDDHAAGLGRRRALAAAQDLGHLREAARADDVEPFDERGLEHALARDDQPREPGACRPLGDRQRAAAGADLAVEPELAEDRVALKRIGRELAAGREDGARDRQVVARARLAQRRRREVDRDALAAGTRSRS